MNPAIDNKFNAVEARPILVWQFRDAPAHYRALSPHGGDEDWLALVPASLAAAWIPWLDDGSMFGCEVSKHELPTGEIICIGAHS